MKGLLILPGLPEECVLNPLRLITLLLPGILLFTFNRVHVNLGTAGEDSLNMWKWTVPAVTSPHLQCRLSVFAHAAPWRSCTRPELDKPGRF